MLLAMRFSGRCRPHLQDPTCRTYICKVQAAAGGAAAPQTHHMHTNASPRLGEPLLHIQSSGCIYLDYNATTPIYPEVSQAMAPFLFQHFGNPSSAHTYGAVCKAAVDKARSQVASLVGAKPSDTFFTSCGTESDNWAIFGTVAASRARLQGRTPHVVASSVEHPAVLAYLQQLQSMGLLRYSLVAVDRQGLVDPEDVRRAMTRDTVLVTIMHSNNEVGAVQPIKEVSAVAHAGGAVMHSDAAQSLGKLRLDVEELGVDMMTMVGHKFGAPKGVAALYVRQGTPLANMLYGGGQEGGRRAGTENVLLLVGLGAAAELALREAAQLTQHMQALRDRLQDRLLASLPQDIVRINGPSAPSQRLPNTLSISIRGFNASQALTRLSSQLAASAGAACHSHDGPSVSGVLKAMQVPTEYALGTLRLSTGRHSCREDVDRAAELILGEVQAQRGEQRQ